MTNSVYSFGSACSTRCVYDTWYWGEEEVAAAKNGVYEEAGKQYPIYQWAGWGHTYKHKRIGEIEYEKE